MKGHAGFCLLRNEHHHQDLRNDAERERARGRERGRGRERLYLEADVVRCGFPNRQKPARGKLTCGSVRLTNNERAPPLRAHIALLPQESNREHNAAAGGCKQTQAAAATLKLDGLNRQ